MKRFIDILFIGIFLVLIIPLFFIISVAVVLLDGLPIFFLQWRVGKNGKEFRLIKFRTMKVKLNSENGVFDAGENIRVTRIGAILRKTKLDELPQLINVLLGDMSLVGPRPEVRKWVSTYPKRWKKVHQVRPGITDSASIVYRHEEQLLSNSVDPELTYKTEILPHKLSLYEKYVDEQSLKGDMRILSQTIFALFR
jgi:lipopolysaccharide/colanic/teichoic acid biosynthesis glycosyltransferase